MPNLSSIVRRFADQDILYWEKTGSDSFGQPVYATAQPLRARWEDKQQEIVLPDNRKVISKGYVLLTPRLLVGSLVWWGSLADWQAQPYYPSIPTVNQGARELIMINTTPGIRQLKGEVNEAYF